jgi:hypothetical protein
MKTRRTFRIALGFNLAMLVVGTTAAFGPIKQLLADALGTLPPSPSV